MGPLKNARHERFVEEYLDCGCAFAAAETAGYSWPATANGFYVYFLIDGRDGSIFYVGKGRGQRVYQHRKQARSSTTTNQVKALRIIECGDQLRETIFADGLNEAEALHIEKALIHRLRECGLSNIQSGHVHPLESLLAGIDRGIAAILPYRVWIATAHPSQLEAAAQLSGSPDEFYVKFVVQFRELRAAVAAQLNSIKGESYGTAGR